VTANGNDYGEMRGQLGRDGAVTRIVRTLDQECLRLLPLNVGESHLGWVASRYGFVTRCRSEEFHELRLPFLQPHIQLLLRHLRASESEVIELGPRAYW
jgi:hypothetical protein